MPDHFLGTIEIHKEMSIDFNFILEFLNESNKKNLLKDVNLRKDSKFDADLWFLVTYIHFGKYYCPQGPTILIYLSGNIAQVFPEVNEPIRFHLMQNPSF
jgi:hypothetical protein